jgi:hypothetical protein
MCRILSNKFKVGLGDLGVVGRIVLTQIGPIKKQGERVWTGFIWLRIGSCGRLL